MVSGRGFLSALGKIQLNCCVVLWHLPETEVIRICFGGLRTAGAGMEQMWTWWKLTHRLELCWVGGTITQQTRIWWNLSFIMGNVGTFYAVGSLERFST